MAKLKHIKKTIIEVDYSDLEEFIKAETGHMYEIICMEELSNDIAQTYDVDDTFCTSHEEGLWEDFKQGNIKQWSLRAILNGLCCEEKIPAGEYLMKVSW